VGHSAQDDRARVRGCDDGLLVECLRQLGDDMNSCHEAAELDVVP
jgi:hypothetical protein